MNTRRMTKIIAVMAIALMIVTGCSQKTEKGGSIVLDENPTTGHTWVYEVKDAGIIEIKDEFIKPESDKSGASGTHKYEISGVKAGETDINYTLKQEWDGGEESEKKTFHITVDKDLVVTIQEK